MKNIRKRDKPKMEKAYFTESKESWQRIEGENISKGDRLDFLLGGEKDFSSESLSNARKW